MTGVGVALICLGLACICNTVSIALLWFAVNHLDRRQS